MRDLAKYEADYGKEGFEDYQAKYRRRKVLELLNEYKPHKILEIGCGKKPMFAEYDFFNRYILFEPADKFFDNAMKIASGDKRISGYHDVFKYIDEVKKENLDFIICSGLLHELENPELLFEDIHSLCNKETIVYVNVPNAKSMHRMLAVSMGLIEDEKQFSDRNYLMQQQSVFDINELKSMVEKAGFYIFSSGTFFIKPFTHDQMWKLLEEQIINADVVEGLYNMSSIFPDAGSEMYVLCKADRIKEL